MIELGKKYQTRDGRAVRILATGVKAGFYSVIGIVTDSFDGNEFVSEWTADGTSISHNFGTHNDLIPVPTKHEGWVAIGKDGFVYGQYARSRVDAGGLIDRKIAEYLAHVTWED